MFATLGVAAQAKEPTLDYKALRIDGLLFYTSKASILKTYGKPTKVTEPNYECGFHAAQQGKRYYLLHYPGLKFIGNAAEGYVLEEVDLGPRYPQRTISYRGKRLSRLTTTADFQKLFGVKVEGNEKGLFNTNADDAFRFHFVGGRLVKIDYWSPC
ncbi:hypothetical protein ASU33_10715 [Solirubrum puertoriconensis]|uniref:Uncharacterized protein n=1 Tax=Solirubrum puertoriconensis TaxID=1751427 RepID=A0A9X0L5E5_SOLP1|nr:hypothetical protein ASU33_10715 [Solirubrum puertoriconensis]